MKRDCLTADGKPKRAYISDEEAMADVQAVLHFKRERLHAYRCPEHGYHIGHAKPVDNE